MKSDKKLLELALNKGLLKPEQLNEIQEALEQSAINAANFSTPLPAFEEKSFGRFQKLEFIGQGGMALVYKAFDPDLGRTVALKFLRGDDDQLIHRLLAEARAQARIEHPNICRVYEVGHAEGKVYIAMQYVAGTQLKELIPKMSLEQKLKLMAQVSDAIHAAHRIGLIHRDIKPANILVERNEDGDFIPYVLDFGLAREVQAPGLTATGLVVGSPFYMSPEQARGEVHKLDRRSDVYSLGTTLYQMLSERLPFEANSSIDVLVAIMQEEPCPLRKRETSIPRDVDTIVMKCLEKEPRRRYESAKALAEDLRRYLDGEPVAARPVGMAYRYYKKARKHKAAVATIGIALLLLVISGSVAVYSRITAKRQAELASRLGEQVKELEGISRYSSMMPLHDVRPEREMIRKRMLQIEQQMRRVGKLGDGPGYYALGQGYLALRDYNKAEESLQKAWQSGYKHPEVAYALGKVTASLYQKALEQVQQVDNEELRKLRVKEVEEKFRAPALQYLEASKSVQLESTEFLSGMIAFLDRRYEEALFHARNASNQIPWLYEAHKLTGDILVTRALEKESIGDYAGARADDQEAGTAYQTALKMAHSDTELHNAECGRFINLMDLDDLQGRPADPDFQGALEACDHTLIANPENEEALGKKSYAHWKWGNVENEAYGKDPRPSLQSAIQTSEKILKHDPTSKDAFNRIGSACFTWGHYSVMHGEDPLPWLHRSIQNFEKAIALDPQFPEVWMNIGIAYGMQANYESGKGSDPSRTLDHAIDSFQKAIARNHDFLGAYHDLSLAYLIKSEWQSGKGLDPRDSLKTAIKNAEKVIHLNPGYVIAYSDRGEALRDLAAYEMDHGQDPRPALDQSVADLKVSVKLRPNFSYAYEYVSRSYEIRAHYELMVDLDPTGSLEAGLDFARQAMQRNNAFPEANGTAGILHRIQAQFLLNQEKNPEKELELAREALKKAMDINAEIFWLYTEKSSTEVIAARWAMQQNRPAEQFFRESEKAIERALKLDATNDSTMEAIGEDALWNARSLRSKTQQAAVIRRGIMMLDKSIAANSQFARLTALKASLMLEMANATTDTEERNKTAKEAVGLFEDAFKRNGNLQTEFKASLQEAERLVN